MENMDIKQVIISKQIEKTDNLEQFYKIIKQKNIKINIVQAGDILDIEKDLDINILWPYEDNLITENGINNNSIVCKLRYKSFSMLFTGDIEEKAEKKIFEIYKNNLNIFESTALKVAHHGSKTSSTQKIIEAVNPKIALIGVGRNNNFGHPNNVLIERFEKLRCKYL